MPFPSAMCSRCNPSSFYVKVAISDPLIIEGLWQVEKLIEETKQVTVMENRVVPETRTIQVGTFFCTVCLLRDMETTGKFKNVVVVLHQC